MSTDEREVTTDLRNKRSVTTTSLITAKSYFGADFKWTPIYGKMAFANQKIIPFDLYFSGGVGITGTSDSQSAPTLHLGTGQIFAINKSMAFRWDFSWNTFSASTKTGPTTSSSVYNNLYLTVGMSFFYPEATYR
jgi:outer membrane beta-barrel protein